MVHTEAEVHLIRTTIRTLSPPTNPTFLYFTSSTDDVPNIRTRTNVESSNEGLTLQELLESTQRTYKGVMKLREIGTNLTVDSEADRQVLRDSAIRLEEFSQLYHHLANSIATKVLEARGQCRPLLRELQRLCDEISIELEDKAESYILASSEEFTKLVFTELKPFVPSMETKYASLVESDGNWGILPGKLWRRPHGFRPMTGRSQRW